MIYRMIRRLIVNHRRFLLSTLGVICGLLISAMFWQFHLRFDPVRRDAWNKVQPRVEKAREETARSIDPSTKIIVEFFNRQRSHARDFAGDLISLSGKWAYAKGMIYGGSHEKYIEHCFHKHFFTPEELQRTMESSITHYIGEIQASENRLLIDIQADLETSKMARPEYLPALASSGQFTHAYQAMIQQVLPLVSQEMGVSISREMASLVGGEIATVLVLEIGSSLATSMGLSGGVIGTGAYAGAFTFGVGLVAGILVDMTIDYIMRAGGYDPEGEIAAKVIDSFNRLEKTILDGRPEAWKGYEDQKFNARWDFRPSRRDLAWSIVQQFEKSGDLGLRFQFQKIHEIRARLQNQALRNLILEGVVK
ncbi:MAG: hypothetical protein ACKO5E_12835 [bacterium]